ncbi:MAG TPA: hypothetical protein VMU09_11180 [Acidimicrobiales bacterium]|nr:hypothetical protein [Acidimicrobiales bacterium]
MALPTAPDPKAQRRDRLFAQAMEHTMGDLEIMGLLFVPPWVGDAIIDEARRRADLWVVCEEIVDQAARSLGA